ncbi:MAG: hypothetical protein OEV49_14400 [candidate division Zixibacteria bacterium]|nr:hypothetical protein [candidate division Zixibacteria bacterium]MDH3938854.1 hypothetical protein [candidate division Zixibacteria bacterium]MDH4033181.1 hypothetical protein [candidate division Zixibacteria bacterium]
MPVSKATKSAVKKELLKGEPLMDLAATKEELLRWLEQWPAPGDKEAGWEEMVREFPAEPEDAKSEKGTCIRLTVRLNTGTNRYMITLLESLDPQSRGVYFATVHVNWKEVEYRRQEAVEQSYAGQFDGSLKAKHNLWTQTFRAKDLAKALNSCAIAILGHELISQPKPAEPGERIPHDLVAPPDFPKTVDE